MLFENEKEIGKVGEWFDRIVVCWVCGVISIVVLIERKVFEGVFLVLEYFFVWLNCYFCIYICSNVWIGIGLGLSGFQGFKFGNYCGVRKIGSIWIVVVDGWYRVCSQ